ncbi:hypothetical protein [Modestobacter sp. SYSU DS0290]
MSPLEERYRRLLGRLPEPARSQWADDMTETYLSVTTADDPEYAEFGSPTVADRLDVARLALRLRLGAPGASVRAVATGATVRLVAVAGTVALAATALVGLVSTAWLHGALPFVDAPDVGGPVHWGPEDALRTVGSALTVVLAGCVVRGLAVTRPLALVVLVGELVLALLRPVQPLDLFPLLTLAVPLVAAALVPTGRPVRHPGWLSWLGLLLLSPWAFGAAAVASSPGEPAGWLLALGDPFVQLGIVLVGSGAVLLARRRTARGPAELAVAVLAAALLPALAVHLPYAAPAGYSPTVLAVAIGTAGTAALTGVVGLRAVRTLPADVPA